MDIKDMTGLEKEEHMKEREAELASLKNESHSRAASCVERQATHSYEIGKNIIIRTVTFTYIGKLITVHEHELVLEKAVWVADTGRFHEALLNGVETLENSEVEAFLPDHILLIGRAAIVDAQVYIHNIPKTK